MESLTRLVTESLARHGFDRPLDYRRLHWSRWFRCESPHSLLLVPSKPGVFAIAEEIMNTHAGADTPRRMLALVQFFEDDDMAFTLDRVLTRPNPMRGLLASGRYFVRFVVIEDQFQRRSISSALNQWIVNSSEKASGIGAHFAASLELTPATEYVPFADSAQGNLFESPTVARTPSSASAGIGTNAAQAPSLIATPPTPHLDPGAATEIHCPLPFPSGF